MTIPTEPIDSIPRPLPPIMAFAAHDCDDPALDALYDDPIRDIPADRLSSTDDCGFSPFSDDTSTSRHTAFAKICARVLGSSLAEKVIGGTA